MATASGKNRGFFFVFIQCRKLRKCVNSQRGWVKVQCKEKLYDQVENSHNLAKKCFGNNK